MPAGWEPLVTISVCYTCRGEAVKKSDEQVPIAAFSNHLLGFRPLFGQFITIGHW